MTVAELRIALADLPSGARVDLIQRVQGTSGDSCLLEYEPVVLLNRQEKGYVVITTKGERAIVEEKYGFIPRRKYSDNQ